MAQYFGTKQRWRWRTAAGPLRPPTPVAPRPPMTPNPNQGGLPTPMGNGEKKYTLPGPGPKAGGRYNMYVPGNPTKNLPLVGPKQTVEQAIQESWESWKQQGGTKYAQRMAGGMMFRWGLSRLNAPLTFASVGFQMMDEWGWFTNPNTPGTPAVPGYHDMSGWTLRCSQAGGRNAYQRQNAAITTPLCGTANQVVEGTWGQNEITFAGPARSLFIGTRAANPARFTIREQWSRNSPVSVIPWVEPIPAGAPGLAPLPDSIPDSWTDPYPEPYPRPRGKGEERPASQTRERTDPRTGTGVRTNPRAPYWPPGYEPPGRVKVPQLPRPGEEKHKFPVKHLPGDFYGFLTEIKDGLKCFEKGLGKDYRRPKGGGLHNRVEAVAVYIRDKPHKVDWRGIIECLIYNQAEDWVIGKANSLANQVTRNPYYTRPVGVGAGSWAMRIG